MPHRQRDDGEGSPRREGRYYIRCSKGGEAFVPDSPACSRCCYPQQLRTHRSSEIEYPLESAAAPSDLKSCESSSASETTQTIRILEDKQRLLVSSQNPAIDCQQWDTNTLLFEDTVVGKDIQVDAKPGPLELVTTQPSKDMLSSLIGTWNCSTSSTSSLGSPFYQRNRIRRLPKQRPDRPMFVLLFRTMVFGALMGGLVVLCFLSIYNVTNPRSFQQFSNQMELVFSRSTTPPHQCSFCQTNNHIRRVNDPTQQVSRSGIMASLNLYQGRWAHSPLNRTATDKEMRKRRRLATSTSSSVGSPNSVFNDDYKDTQLVIAGKMSVEDAPCNIAQYNLKKNKWSLTERIQLSLYNSYSGGEVYSLLANHTSTSTRHKDDFTKDEESESKRYVC
jgi:hypothetical protein